MTAVARACRQNSWTLDQLVIQRHCCTCRWLAQPWAQVSSLDCCKQSLQALSGSAQPSALQGPELQGQVLEQQPAGAGAAQMVSKVLGHCATNLLAVAT